MQTTVREVWYSIQWLETIVKYSTDALRVKTLKRQIDTINQLVSASSYLRVIDRLQLTVRLAIRRTDI